MSALSDYIEKVRRFIEQNPDITEDLLIRYVYLDLGRRLSFNSEFRPFGNSKKRQEIYLRSNGDNEINNCLENDTVICLSASRLLAYILNQFGVNIKTVTDKNSSKRWKHVYNIVYPKNGGEPYSIDLQEDMYRIQMHGFTSNYGISIKDGITQVIPRPMQEQMDRRLGYIDNEHYYTDDYLYLLKSDFGLLDTFEERARFILENIETFENPKMQYTDRQWYHVRVLENFFSLKDFNYDEDCGRIKFVDCFKIRNGQRMNVSLVTVKKQKGSDVYIYNPKEGGYRQIDLVHIARAVKNGLTIVNGRIPGLKEAMSALKDEVR